MSQPHRNHEALPMILLVTAILMSMAIESLLLRLSLISVVCWVMWRFDMLWFLDTQNKD